MNKKIVLSVIFLFVSSLSFAQRSSLNGVFVSAYAGDLAILSENFLESYGSKNDAAYGIGVGLSISNTYTLNASVTYFNKKSSLSEINEINPIINSELEQLILNAGVQVHLLPNRIIGLSILCGLNYSLVVEERKSASGQIISRTKEGGNFGIYGGANFEVSFGRTPIALFGDVKYTYSWSPVLDYEKSYREIRYMGGLKFYITPRWK